MSDRIYSDKFTRQEVEEVSEEAKRKELSAQLATDIQNDAVKRPPTRLERKFNRIFGSAGQTTQTFVTGFKMGCLVGAGFGGVMGVYQAVQLRTFMVIPMAMIGSGVSFGFFMGLGMTIRS